MNEQPAPLWSDEQISEEVETLALGYKARHVLRRMRDHYEAMLSMACQMSPSEEATIARLTQANAELAAEVARLKAEMAEVKTRLSGTEAAQVEIESLMFDDGDDDPSYLGSTT